MTTMYFTRLSRFFPGEMNLKLSHKYTTMVLNLSQLFVEIKKSLNFIPS